MATNNKKLHIELFAGCGGMGLGLEAAGFDLLFANELSPMAGETFAYNLLQEDLLSLSTKNKKASKTLWINSAYPSDDLKSRLRESPFTAKNGSHTDLTANVELDKKLLVGDIDQLLKWLAHNKKIIKQLRDRNVTLISGGPPCQSFSLAGKREKNNAKNLLPLSFAKVAGLIQPKFVLLENVKGITAPFIENGKKHYAWFEVAKAFALEGYVPVSMLLNSKFFGVPQNRPRFILMAIRLDIAKQIIDKQTTSYLDEAYKFYNLVKRHKKNLENVTLDKLNYYDIEENPELFNGYIFPNITNREDSFVSAKSAIEDLISIDNTNNSNSQYSLTLNTTFPTRQKFSGVLENHEQRKHSYPVMARFRLYQVISEFKNGNKKSATDFLTSKEVSEPALDKVLKELINHELFLKDNDDNYFYKRPDNEAEAQEHLQITKTKKHSQRALKAELPAPAQLTIPDDLCHYDKEQLRTLTVREMARFQSFPDWFVFRSKITTGGDQRKFETPQYTQVGNAVPPLLAKAIGDAIVYLLKDVK